MKSVVEKLNLDRRLFDWAMNVKGQGVNKVNSVIDLPVWVGGGYEWAAGVSGQIV